jgi:hypothetical protein
VPSLAVVGFGNDPFGDSGGPSVSEAAVTVSERAGPPEVTAESSRRWWILGVVGLAQLMVVLDATIVNIALPSAQRALAFSNADRQLRRGILGIGRDPGRLRGRVRAGAGLGHPGACRPGGAACRPGGAARRVTREEMTGHD